MDTISIISACLDDAPYLDEAVRSAMPVDGIRVEHILVHDGSARVRDEVRRRHPHLNVVGGEGRGPVAAFNRGLSMAKGEFVGILPADDLLHPQALHRLRERGARRRDCMVWTGGLMFFAEVADGSRKIIKEVALRQHTRMSRANVLDGPPLWSGRFYRRDIYEEFGLLSERFAECNDREYMLRLIEAGVRDRDLGGPVGLFRVHPGSRTTNPSGEHVVSFLASHVELAGEMMAGRRGQTGDQYRNWHARELCRLLCHLAKRADWARALEVVRRETAANPLWPMRAVSLVGAGVRARR